MKPNKITSDTLFGGILYDEIIPETHPFRLMKNAINWNEIKKELQKSTNGNKIEYSYTGAPAIDPLIIFKLLLLQRWHPASDRKVLERAKTDASYRFILDVPLPLPLPDYSNLSKFRTLWGEKKIKQIFDIVFKQIQSFSYADVSKGVLGDITHAHYRLQRPTARNLLLDCLEKYLVSYHSFVTIFPSQFDKLLIDQILKEFQEWEELYKAKLLSKELSREKRLTEVVIKVLDIKTIVNQTLTNGNVTDLNKTKEFYSFIGISELLDQIMSENISVSRSTSKSKASKAKDQSKEELKDQPKEELKDQPKEELKDQSKEEFMDKPKEELKDQSKEEFKDKPKEELKDKPKEEFKDKPKEEPNTGRKEQEVVNNNPENDDSLPLETAASPNIIVSQKKGERKIISTVDPEARIGCKHGKTFFLGPKIAITMTKDGFISDIYAISGSPSDMNQLQTMIANTIQTSGQIPETAGFDLGFSSITNRLYLHSMGIQPVIDFGPSSNKRNSELFGAEKFMINFAELSVTCPNNITTHKSSTTEKSNNFTFYFPKNICGSCPLAQQCTTNKNGRTVNVSKFQYIVDADKSFLQTDSAKKVRGKRWQLEGLNGTLKSQEKLGDIPYHGLSKTNLHVRLVGIVRNLKKLTKLILSQTMSASSVPSTSGYTVS